MVVKPEERVDIDRSGSPWREEHLARYHFAIPYIKEKQVLDIACGTGFGSELLLSNGAQKVFSADASQEALDASKLRLDTYKERSDISIQDGTRLTFEDSVFDIIVSFETIEHIENYEGFLTELHRVLKHEGTLLISTPNALVTKPVEGKPINPYHIKEFEPEEFITLLKKHFEVELAAGQHLPDEYGVAPFLSSFNVTALNFYQKINVFYWKLVRRLPNFLRNQIHRLIFGFNFFPSMEDYTFYEKDLPLAHVMYFVCRKK